MAISVVVREHTGEVVARGVFAPGLRGDVVLELAEAALDDYARFPLLAGVAPYLDTSFNEWQCLRLIDELTDLRHDLDDAAAVDELVRLARLVVVDGPGQVHHRRLVFVGD
ncbi:hypothetical protein [Cellulomonas sp. P5_C5]